MRCKNIERMMIDESERPLSRDELEVLARHLSRCHACAKFQRNLVQIRNSLESMPVPLLPEELAEKTRALCRSRLRTPLLNGSGAMSRSASVPGAIWVSLFLLVILSGIEVISFFSSYDAGESLSFQAILALTLLAQNVLMLFFAPVLIPRFSSRKNGFGLNGHEKFVG